MLVFAVERLGVDERIAAFRAKEVELVIVPMSQSWVVEGDIGFAFYGGLALVTPYAEAL